MRTVKLYRAQYNPETRVAETVENGFGMFHQFMNRSVINSDGKVVLEIVAVIEMADGSVRIINPDNMKFWNEGYLE